MFVKFTLLIILFVFLPNTICSREELEATVLRGNAECKKEFGISDEVEAAWFNGDYSVVDDNVRVSQPIFP